MVISGILSEKSDKKGSRLELYFFLITSRLEVYLIEWGFLRASNTITSHYLSFTHIMHIMLYIITSSHIMHIITCYARHIVLYILSCSIAYYIYHTIMLWYIILYYYTNTILSIMLTIYCLMVNIILLCLDYTQLNLLLLLFAHFTQ